MIGIDTNIVVRLVMVDDALHLSAVANCESFASFNPKLARVAARNKLKKVLEP